MLGKALIYSIHNVVFTNKLFDFIDSKYNICLIYFLFKILVEVGGNFLTLYYFQVLYHAHWFLALNFKWCQNMISEVNFFDMLLKHHNINNSINKKALKKQSFSTGCNPLLGCGHSVLGRKNLYLVVFYGSQNCV